MPPQQSGGSVKWQHREGNHLSGLVPQSVFLLSVMVPFSINAISSVHYFLD